MGSVELTIWYLLLNIPLALFWFNAGRHWEFQRLQDKKDEIIAELTERNRKKVEQLKEDFELWYVSMMMRILKQSDQPDETDETDKRGNRSDGRGRRR